MYRYCPTRIEQEPGRVQTSDVARVQVKVFSFIIIFFIFILSFFFVVNRISVVSNRAGLTSETGEIRYNLKVY